MTTPPAGGTTTSELDAMFGVVTGPAPGPSAPPQPVRRSNDLKARMRAAFAGDVPSRLAELERAIASDDHETAGRLLHGIKGSAAYLDEVELHRLCSDLEIAADSRQWEALHQAMPRLLHLLSVFETPTA
jgi:HPt (histidine-containing phosphotransfer) domain-containing protein